jgi:hypothetical protein
MPTRRSEVEARCQGDLHHGALTPPTAQAHHGTTREPVEVVHSLDAHTHPWVTHGGQKDFVAVVVGTAGSLTALADSLVQVMKKRASWLAVLDRRRYQQSIRRANTARLLLLQHGAGSLLLIVVSFSLA